MLNKGSIDLFILPILEYFYLAVLIKKEYGHLLSDECNKQLRILYVKSQQTSDVGPALAYCWHTVYDFGPTVNQRWADASCLLGYTSMCTIVCDINGTQTESALLPQSYHHTIQAST